jgi:predicted RNA-binding Zn ribbon-like protein
VEAEEGRLMLDVTWEWIAIDKAALDVANTVAVEKGTEHDLLAAEGEYERWAAAAARSPELRPGERAAIAAARPRVLELRNHVRAVFHATVAAEPLPSAAVAALNEASRAAPQWPELADDGRIETRGVGDPVDRLLAGYARSAMEIAGGDGRSLRVCGAPSCGMFYRPRRRDQRWCSEPCGNRARFARHYSARRRAASRA